MLRSAMVPVDFSDNFPYVLKFAEGLGALRELLARLVEMGLQLRAQPLGVVVDVDRPDDLAAAELLSRDA
jgi:CTP:molybdopterin cytidylyltransferase MocA